MPYIDPKYRKVIDPHLQTLLENMTYGKSGLTNYVITKIVHESLGCNNYYEINEAIGVLECAKQELYRRIAVPYEEKKAYENGDVY